MPLTPSANSSNDPFTPLRVAAVFRGGHLFLVDLALPAILMLILAVVFASATHAQEWSTDELHKFDGRMAESVPYVSFRSMSVNPGENVHLEVMRGQEKLAFDMPMMEPTDSMDQISALADPEKNLIRPLGI